jgi:hypothetical protein
MLRSVHPISSCASVGALVGCVRHFSDLFVVEPRRMHGRKSKPKTSVVVPLSARNEDARRRLCKSSREFMQRSASLPYSRA